MMDKTVIYLPCSTANSEECKDKPSVQVRAIFVHPDSKPLKYKYTVSAGKIIGEGAEVEWDLSGVSPSETNMITVVAEDGKNFRETSTRTINVKQCDCSSSKAISSPTPDSSGGVESVTVDKNTVATHCEWMPFDGGDCSEEKSSVKVTAVAKNAEKDNLTYYYIISGGRIIGQGANVTWSFIGARPGKHTITVAAGSDNIIRGKTITKTVELVECICDPPPPPCVCPTVTVSGPAKGFKAGDSVIFTAEVKGGTQTFTTYKWSVSSGTITSGQEASQIIVKTATDEAADSLTATVEIGGYKLCEECPRTFSKSVSRVSKKP